MHPDLNNQGASHKGGETPNTTDEGMAATPAGLPLQLRPVRRLVVKIQAMLRRVEMYYKKFLTSMHRVLTKSSFIK